MIKYQNYRIKSLQDNKLAIQFHKEVLKTTSGWTTFVFDNSSTSVIRKTTSNLHENALSAGFQFTEFLAPNGVKLKVEVDSFYDDPVRNKIMHPLGKKSAA